MYNHEWKDGQLTPATGPLDYEWSDHGTALKLAGFEVSWDFSPHDVTGHLTLYDRLTAQEPSPWSYEFLCEYSLDGDRIRQVYCRNYHDAVEVMRFLQPLLEMSWRCWQQSEEWDDRMKKYRLEHPSSSLSKEERKSLNAANAVRDKKYAEDTREAWARYLVSVTPVAKAA